MLSNLVLVLCVVGSAFGAQVYPCEDSSLSCVRSSLGPLTGLRVFSGLGENVYTDTEEVSVAGVAVSQASYSGLYSAEIYDYYNDGTNTFLTVFFPTLPTELVLAEGAVQNIFTNVYVTIKFDGIEDLSLDNAVYTAVIESAEFGATSLESVTPVEAASALAERIAKAYFYSQVATSEPEQEASTVITSTVQNRECEVTDLDCIKAKFAEISGLTAITAESSDSYVDPEPLVTEFGFFNGTFVDDNTYSGLNNAEIIDFYNDGTVTVFTVAFHDLSITRSYTAYLYTENSPPTTFTGAGTYKYTTITVTATFEGVDTISVDNFQAYSYPEGHQYVAPDYNDFSAAAATNEVVANALAVITANPTSLVRAKAFAVGPRLIKTFIYSKIASPDGAPLAQ